MLAVFVVEEEAKGQEGGRVENRKHEAMFRVKAHF